MSSPARTIFDRTARFEIDVPTARATITRFTQHRPLSGLRVLDVGCRNGDSVQALTELGADAWGIDLSPVCVAHARRRFPRLAHRYHCHDLRQLDALTGEHAGPFDLVLCVGVLPYAPPDAWLAAIGGMGRRCVPGGEVRVLLQHTRPPLVQHVVDVMSALPEPVFARGVAPLVTAGLWPLSRRLLGARIPAAELHYRVSLSLYGLHFGYPAALDPYRYPVEACRFIAPRLSAAFAIPASDCAGWLG